VIEGKTRNMADKSVEKDPQNVGVRTSGDFTLPVDSREKIGTTERRGTQRLLV